MVTSNMVSSSSDKPYSITNIKAYIPFTLDLERMNYDAWHDVFETQCVTFGVNDHLSQPDDKAADRSDKKEWTRVDSLVKMWIFGTMTQSLTQTIHKKNQTAVDLWSALENLFHDNKDTRDMQLDQELHNISQRDTYVNAYCSRIKNLAELLEKNEAPVPEKNLVSYTINGLHSHLDHIASILRHRTSFLTFLETRSIFALEEKTMNQLQ
ncbi:hypothetical protein Lser_V15G12469 [Lactuca serriola]